MTLRVVWPDTEADMPDQERRALHAELSALSETPTFAEQAPTLAARIPAGAVLHRDDLPMPELLTLLRALEHLRNARTLGPQGRRVRESMTAASNAYTLRFGWGGQDEEWMTWGGAYEVGDRVVTGPDQAFRVTDRIHRKHANTVLVCEGWV